MALKRGSESAPALHSGGLLICVQGPAGCLSPQLPALFAKHGPVTKHRGGRNRDKII